MSTNSVKQVYKVFYILSLTILIVWLGFYRNREQMAQVGLVLLSIATYLAGVIIHIRPLPQARKVHTFRIATTVLFFVYILILADILFLGNLFLIGGRTGGAVNLIPFQSIRNSFNDILGEHSLWSAVNLFGNILLFVPAGICLPIIFKKMRTIPLFCIVLISALVAVEIIQNITQTGSTDIDDFILNFVGAILAWIVTNAVIKFVKKN